MIDRSVAMTAPLEFRDILLVAAPSTSSWRRRLGACPSGF